MYYPWLKRFLDKWPGKKLLGVYRFLPVFFGIGAMMEFTMIKWQVGQTNFYNTFKRREAQTIIEEILAESNWLRVVRLQITNRRDYPNWKCCPEYLWRSTCASLSQRSYVPVSDPKLCIDIIIHSVIWINTYNMNWKNFPPMPKRRWRRN